MLVPHGWERPSARCASYIYIMIASYLCRMYEPHTLEDSGNLALGALRCDLP